MRRAYVSANAAMLFTRQEVDAHIRRTGDFGFFRFVAKVLAFSTHALLSQRARGTAHAAVTRIGFEVCTFSVANAFTQRTGVFALPSATHFPSVARDIARTAKISIGLQIDTLAIAHRQPRRTGAFSSTASLTFGTSLIRASATMIHIGLKVDARAIAQGCPRRTGLSKQALSLDTQR